MNHKKLASIKQFGLGWGTYRNQGVLVEYRVSITRKLMSGVKNLL